MSDRGYINLIRHLTRSTSSLPLDTLQASIAHYLARPPIPVPASPTPLTATVLNSPLFRPYTHQKLSALTLAFRHAVHLRVAVHKEAAENNLRGVSSRGVNVGMKLAKWCRAVLEGYAGSAAVVRLACASGLLLGLEDWESELKLTEKETRVRAKVEEEVVLALAEVVDAYSQEGSGWETDFKGMVNASGEDEGASLHCADMLSLTVLFASQCAHFVASQRLQALPLPTIIDVLINTIDRSFHGGAFLSAAPSSMSTDTEGHVFIQSTSPFAHIIYGTAGSVYIASMASLAKFTALALTVLMEYRPSSGWETIGTIISRLRLLTNRVEKDWTKCPLAGLTQDTDLCDHKSRNISTATWSILKTLLFTTLMVSQSILSTAVFVPNPHGNNPFEPEPSDASHSLSSYALALNVLHTLSHLSFVMPHFGGIASTTEGGLPELKRAFYMALDVLSARASEARRFIEESSDATTVGSKGKVIGNLPRSLVDARKTFALACAEQLVPVLSEETIQSQVYPMCLPHLWDPSHRETYESAHSVMLSLFASHAQKATNPHVANSHPAFAEKIVPMYAQCLVQNSSEGRLSTTQLCMAYAALVRSASSFGYARSGSAADDGTHAADSTAWFCIEVLLDGIRHAHAAPVRATLPYSPDGQTSTSSPSTPASAAVPEITSPAPSEHLHRLHLALVATVPSVSLVLLPRLLIEVKAIVLSVSTNAPTTIDRRTEEMRDELVQALFKSILKDVGDAEKQFAIDWWYDNRDELGGGSVAPKDLVSMFNGNGTETSTRTGALDLVSRL